MNIEESMEKNDGKIDETIDWILEEDLINSSYRLNDVEVKEAMELLEKAKQWVQITISSGKKVTERIKLIGKNDCVLHVVRLKSGLPSTKDIKAETHKVFDNSNSFIIRWVNNIWSLFLDLCTTLGFPVEKSFF